MVTSNLTAGCPQREKPPVSGSKNWLPKTEFELPQGDLSIAHNATRFSLARSARRRTTS
jgi:hypothetical protein